MSSAIKLSALQQPVNSTCVPGCKCVDCRIATPRDVGSVGSSIDCNPIPLSVNAPDPDLLRRLPGVLSLGGSMGSRSGNRHRKKHPKETSIAYGDQVRVPGIAKHISGFQTIRIQATQQDADAFNTSTTVPTFLGQPFSLSSNVQNATAYTALFDEYKIDEIEVWINPNPLTTLAASTQRGLYSSAVDYDDANTPGTISTVSDKQNSLTTAVTENHYHKFVPRFAYGTYSGTFTSFGSTTGWIDCASPSVQHYGLKIASSATAGGIQFVSLTVRLTVSFRSPGIS